MYVLGILCLVAATAALPVEDSVKRKPETSKKEKGSVIAEQPLIFQVLKNPSALTDAIRRFQDSEKRANILSIAGDCTTLANNKYKKKGTNGIAKIALIVIPSSPEQLYDYSNLKKQKFYDAPIQEANNLKKEKDSVITEKAFRVQDQSNPQTLPSSITEPRDLDVHANILGVASNPAQVADRKYDEEVKHNTVKIASVAVPAPPELPPFDYSILRQQITNQKQKFYNALIQEADNLKKEKEPVVIEKALKVQARPNQPTFPSSITEPQFSDIHANTLGVTSDFAQVADRNYGKEVKHNTVKIATVPVPAPPELPPFDYSILRQKITDQKQKIYNAPIQEADNLKKEKHSVIIEKAFSIQNQPSPQTTPSSTTEPQDSDVHANILGLASNSAQVADRKCDEEVKHNTVKIAAVAVPAPPELPPFDYSILRQQITDQKQKFYNASIQEADNLKKEKESFIIAEAVKVQAQPNQPTIPSSITEPRDLDVHANILGLASNSAQVADRNYGIEEKPNTVKITTGPVPAPPELPPFDYSILRQRLADQQQKFYDAPTQEADNLKKEKESFIIEEAVKVQAQPNQSTIPSSITEPRDLDVHANILGLASNSAQVADRKCDEEVKHNTVKIAAVAVPAPPELPPYDYSILRQQITDQKHKAYDAPIQEADNLKKEKESFVIEEAVKVQAQPNQPIIPSSITEPRDLDVHANILGLASNSAQVADRNYGIEEKQNTVKITTGPVPAPPELPPFDYSILRQRLADQKQKFYDAPTQEADNLKKEKESFIIEEAVKVQAQPNQPTIPSSITEPRDLDVHANILGLASNSAEVADRNYGIEEKQNTVKITTGPVPAPPELPPYDYSILRQQITDQKHKAYDAPIQEADNLKKEKESFVIEEAVKVQAQPNQPIIPSSITEPRDLDVHANILGLASNSAQVADRNYGIEEKQNTVKITTGPVPAPPELPPFDYSILRKRLADQKQKFYDAPTQEADNLKKEKESFIIEEAVKVQAQPNQPTIPSSITEPRDLDVHANILGLASNSAQVADRNYGIEEKQNTVKITTGPVPAPPELPPYDYSILRQQITDQKHKAYDAPIQEADNLKKEKESFVIEEAVKVQAQPNQPIIPSSITEPRDLDVHANILGLASNSAQVADRNYGIEEKQNTVKITTGPVPAPPELPPYDYSILRQQITDQKHKAYDAPIQEADNLKKEKESFVIEEAVKVQAQPNQPIIPSSITEPRDLDVHANILGLASNSAQVVDRNYGIEEKQNTVKITTGPVPAPPELPPFDYSILRKRLADQKHKFDDAPTQEADNLKKEKESFIIEEAVKVQSQPNQPTIPSSITEPRDLDVHANILGLASNSDQVADRKYDEEVKHNTVKIAAVALPAPPELPPFDYSILRQRLADQKQKFYNASIQEADNLKKDKDSIILEEAFSAQAQPNPPALPSSITEPQDSDVHANILGLASNSAQVADRNYGIGEKQNTVKITTGPVPAPPELPPFDYSILRKRLADQKHKFYDAPTQEADNLKKEKESFVIEEAVKVQAQPNQPIIPSSITEPRDLDVHANILGLASNSAQVADRNYGIEEKQNTVKITTGPVPAPPELPPFDYSILRQRLADQQQKFYDAPTQEADNLKKEKESFIIEEAVKVQAQPNQSTIPSSITEPRDLDVHANILGLASNSAQVADRKCDEEVKHNTVKIAAVAVPAPPELPPYDYSILRQQITDQKHKAYDAPIQEADNLKKEKESFVIEEAVKVQAQPNQPIIPSSITEPRDLDVHANILGLASNSAQVADRNYGIEEKQNTVKITTGPVPAPPELPPFDYSILRKRLADQKQKFYDAPTQEADNLKKEKESFIIEEAVKVQAQPNQPTIPSSITEPRDLDVHANILGLASNSAQVADRNYGIEEKQNTVKITTGPVPAPPELPPYDYSILRQQITDQKHKAYDAPIQEADNLKKEKESFVIEEAVKVQAQPNQPIIPSSITEPRDLDVHANILGLASNSAQVADRNYGIEEKQNTVKITTGPVPAPPELPPYDYSILRQQITDQKHKAYDAPIQEADNLKKEKESFVIEEAVKVQAQPNQPIIPSSITEPRDLDVHANILGLASNSAQVVDRNYGIEEKQNTVKITTGPVPAPPELPPFDYSILRKRLADQKHKFDDAPTQEADNLKKEKESFIIEEAVKVQSQPNQPTIPSSITEPRDLDVHANILGLASNSDQVADRKYDEEVKHNTVKIAAVALPAPPELPPFDYSILRQRLADQKQKFYNASIQEADNLKKDKDSIILEEAFSAQAQPNPPALPSSITEPQDSDVHANILGLASNSAQVADRNYGIGEKQNTVKITTGPVPAPPELPPFDYSILRKRLADQKHKFYDAPTQEADNLKKEKESFVIEEAVKVQAQPNQPIIPSSITEPRDLDVHANILGLASNSAQVADRNYGIEEKQNTVKITTGPVPAPPELPPFDYSILRKHKDLQKQKSEDFLKAKKSKKDKKFYKL